MSGCPYRYLFGKPGEGPHSYRFMGLAVVDTVLTFLSAWLITLGTIGDHRFRIPTMGLSLLLQVAGILAIRDRVTKAL